MRGRTTMRFGCIAAAALLAVSATGVFAAAEEAENGTGTFEVEAGENGTVTLTNDTGAAISEVTYTEADDASGGSLLITEEDGTEHTFENVDLTEEQNYNIIAKFSFFYVIGEEYEEEGEDEAREEVWNYEDADGIELDEPVTMYVLADMNIRAEGDTDAEIVGSADVGTEVEVSGGTPIWFSVTQGDTEGYIAARYLTEDEEEAEEAAEAAAAAAETEETLSTQTEAQTEAQPETTQSETAQTETQSETAQSETTQTEAQSGTEDVDGDADPYASDAGGYYYEVDGVTYQDVAPDSDAGGYYYQVDGEWYEDESPDSDAEGYFYYETADGKRYRILDSNAVSVGYDDPEQDAVFGYDYEEPDGYVDGYSDDIDGDVDPYASDAGGY